MSQSKLAAPQLVIDSRMVYSSWIPADPKAAAALLPAGLAPAANGAIYMNQYVVDSAEQTTGFGAYSLTYMGLDLSRTAPDGVTPARFFTNYFNSSEVMREYVLERGVPATPGMTTVEVQGHELEATTYVDGVAIYSHPGETSDISSAYTLAAGSHNFTVDYVEGNGSPSVLTFDAPGGVPEPATWAMMIAGFGGVGAMIRSRRRIAVTA
jgi:hypothetical protein